MRFTILLSLCLLPIWCFSQDSMFENSYNPTYGQVQQVTTRIPLKDDRIFYQRRFEHQLGKDQAYHILRRWLVDNFSSIQGDIQIDDKDTYTLVGRAVRMYTFKSGVNRSSFSMYFTVGIEVNDHTADISVYNIYGNDKRTNNLQMYLEATNSVLNDTNFDQHNSTKQFDIDVTDKYFDYLKGKKKKYNGKLLYSVDSEVNNIFHSAEKILM